MLHVGSSIDCRFNGNFNAECAVRHPSATMLDLAQTAAITTDMRNVLLLPFHLGNKNHRFHHQLLSFTHHTVSSRTVHSFEQLNLMPGDHIYVPIPIFD